jgi:predicted TIM-barrel fold metal-dependent hydrolase
VSLCWLFSRKRKNGKQKDLTAFTALPELIALAKYPNVAVKASGAPGSSESYPYRDIHHIRQIYDAFGPERIFW